LRTAGRRAVALALGAVLLEAVFGVAVHLGMPGGVGSLVGESAIGVVVYLCCRQVAASAGGWEAAFALALPRRRDAGLAARWLMAQTIARYGVVLVAIAAIPALRHGRHVGNLGGLHNLTPIEIAMVGIAAVVVAPIIEEVAFRGLWLRALMTRWGFWPAALVSSLVFGLLHAHEGSSLPLAGVLVLATGTFGVLQSMLVRRSGRLAPAILVHAAANALALAASLAAAH
jgi:membrane protease YdiL (CAAX protease family)